MVEETEKWLEGRLAEQEKAALTEEPVFLAAELMRKVRGIGVSLRDVLVVVCLGSRGREDCFGVAVATD